MYWYIINTNNPNCSNHPCPDFHDDVIKWKHFPRYWSFVREIDRSSVNSPHKDKCCRALMFSLITAWTNSWTNNGYAGDLRRHRAHHDVIVMHRWFSFSQIAHIFVLHGNRCVRLISYSDIEVSLHIPMQEMRIHKSRDIVYHRLCYLNRTWIFTAGLSRKHQLAVSITVTPQWRLEPPANKLFLQKLVLTNVILNDKVPHNWSFVRDNNVGIVFYVMRLFG